MKNILSVISAMAEVAHTPPHATTQHPRQPVVTISRDYGSGGDVIAERLAQRLSLPIYDNHVLKEVAARLADDPEVVRLLDEGFGRAKDMWLYRLFSGKDIGPDSYRDSLIKVILSLGRLGGIIVGRGAHVILRDACALRVRVSGSPELCAHRLSVGGLGTEKEMLDKVHEVNHHRGKFVWEVFHSRLSDANQYDMTINTDRMNDFEDVVDMLVPLATAIHAGKVLREDFGHI
jgi:cytidylate kinase